MLRKSRALPLALFCILFAAILEALDILVARNHGISTRDSHIIIPIRYIPTAGAVVFGFLWKALAGEVKAILPWSLMSAGWTSTANSLTLNYINKIEIASLVTAYKRKHWSILLVLTVGFLTGASVAIANVLTYTDSSAVITTDSQLMKTSTFSFENAFESPSGTDVRINLDWTYELYGYISVIQCPGSDNKQIAGTIGGPTKPRYGKAGDFISVRVNIPSGRVINYTMLSDPVPIDLPMSMEAMWIHLNNPADTRFQASLNEINNRSLISGTIKADMYTVGATSKDLVANYENDLFFEQLTDDSLVEATDLYFNNPDLFRSDIETLGAQIMVQVINALGRKDEAQQITGSAIIEEPRLFIQSTALLTMALLLLSYLCSGMDSSVKSLSSYNTLQSLSKRQLLLIGPRESLTFWVPFASTGMKSGIAVIASSMTLLLFPVIKVVAAGLFAHVKVLTTKENVATIINTGWIDNLEQFPVGSATETAVKSQAAQFTEWTVTPSSNVDQTPGIIDNLVFGESVDFDNQPGSASTLGYELQRITVHGALVHAILSGSLESVS
ncbi:hypothetical protein SLS55_006809 [Diplodia seriata]|uniref:Uncharacterized protein n=1 Tax=Diplodia seriata TaxID=420778 RepID=A0ABR3CD19_9PEZI